MASLLYLVVCDSTQMLLFGQFASPPNNSNRVEIFPFDKKQEEEEEVEEEEEETVGRKKVLSPWF